MYLNCLFYILNIYCKRFLFQFLRCGIHFHIPFLTGVQKGHISLWKMVIFCYKNVLLKLNLQDEGHFDSNCLLYILSFYLKRLLFQFFTRGIRMDISILTRVQRGHISGQKHGHILQKMFFWRLVSKIKITWMPLASFIFSLFNVNPYFLSFYVVVYVFIFPSHVQNGRMIC